MQMTTTEYRNEFIRETAEDLIRNLSEEDREMILQNPDYVQHHFWLGLYIRNRYIYNNPDLSFWPYHADHISHDIFDCVVSLLRERL